MNKQLYKIIFSKRLGTLVAVGEHATSAGKTASGQGCRGTVVADGFVGVLRFTFASVALAWLSLSNTQAQSTAVALASTALPQGASVSTGSATISTNGAAMAITQSTDKASINWQSFNVGTGASVNIAQPSANAVLLNRVVGNDPSQILGKLTANGQVILLNPNGVLFGKDGSVTASTFTASTFGLTDADFMAGYYKYNRNGSTAAVVNQGTIETSVGGFVALIGATVTNEGRIIAPQGDVVLAAAESVTLPEELVKPQPAPTPSTVSVRMSKRVRLELDPAAVNTAVNNTESGVIVTEGGQVLLQAAAISSAVASVTHSGRIDTSAPQAGAVTILADNGVIKVDGTITANSSGTDNQGQVRKGADIIIGRDEETGVLAHFTDVSGAKLESNQGFVETSGDVLSTTGTRVKAGEWLLDPYNISIEGTGSTTPGATDLPNYTTNATSTILASDVASNLNAGTNVTIKTTGTNGDGLGAGNIAVNESIAKTGGSDATLTLQAHGNITVAASKTITSNTGKLNVVFNSDSDATNGGGIVFNAGSGITSNGGNITLGGGTALNGTGYAIADGTTSLQGISLNTATINAGGGNIVMKGKTAATNYVGSLSTINGLYMAGGSISTSGSGTIDLSGYNQNTDTQSKGLELASGTITGGSTGAVTITGDSRGVASSTFTYIKGALVNGTVTSTGGNINITGYGGAGVQYDNGVDIAGSVIAVGSGAINITGTAGAGGSGGNVGVSTSGSGTISSVDGAIAITGTGGIGNGSQIRDHGVVIGGTNAIKSTGTGNITVTGTVTNNDNGFSRGVEINTGGLNTNSGNIKVDATALLNYQVAAYINAPITSTSGNVYIRSAGANIQNTTTGTISGYNVSIDNTGGTIDANGVITKGAGGASTWAGVIEQNGIGLSGSVTAGNNLNMYGNQTGGVKGIQISGATTTVSGKNVTLYGKSNSGNGVLLSGATLSGQYLNATGETTSGTAGFVWSGGKINTTGASGTSTASVVKGISAASANTNGFGAFMMIANSATNAASGTSLTFAGEATNLAAGVNTNERGILVQGGYTLTATGDITFDGSSKSSEGIAFGGTINMGTVAGVTNKLTLKGTDASSSNGGWNALNFSGAINGNAATSSINLIGDAKNLSGTNWDNAVNVSGAITGNAANVNIQSTGAKIVTSAAISGANISIDNTNGTINSSTGAITAGVATAGSATAISIGGSITATGDVDLNGHSSSLTGIIINSAIKADNGTVTLVGTTDASTRPSNTAYAGVTNNSTVSGKNINLTAKATHSSADVLGYYGARGSLIATGSLIASASSAGSGVGFYMWGGTTQSGTGMTITGTSNTDYGIALENNASLSNSTSGGLSLTGSTNSTTTRSAISLAGSSISNSNEGVTLLSSKGHITTTGNLTNTITAKGDISITAGQTASSIDAIDASLLTITQNANANVLVSTSGTGNVTAPKIVNNGTGNVVVAAGSDIAAGDGTGGQVLTVAGNSITQSSTGTTYIYSGQASSTGALSTLTSDFNMLYYQGSSHAVNAGFNKTYDGTPANDLAAPAGGSVSNGAQVFFRSTTKPSFTLTLNGLNKQYGDVDPTIFVATGGITTLTNAYAGAGGNNNFAVATSDVIAALTSTRTAGENVGNYAYTLDGSSMNTTLSAQPNLNITKRSITLTSVTAAEQQYDGGTAAAINGGVFGNLANGETLALSGSGVFADANAGAGKAVSVSDQNTLGQVNGTGLWSNYNLTSSGAVSGTGDITKAALTLTVNNSSVFVTQLASSAPNQGFSYSGFVNGDDASVLSGTPTRTYTGAASYPVAGTYTSVLGATGLPTAANYVVSTVVPGNLTVTPADKLLITIGSQSAVYGSQTAASAGVATPGSVTAQYCFVSTNCNAPNLVDLTLSRITDSQWKAADNTGSYVVFDTSVLSPQASGSGYLKVGNYTYTSSEIAPLSLPNGNFTGRETNGGVLTITPLAVSLTSVPVSKTADGTTALPAGIQPTNTLIVSNKLSGDTLDTSFATGAYTSSTVSTAASFSLLGVQLSGADAGNYSLTDYANSTYTGTGSITANNNGGNGSNGSTQKPIIHPPKPIIPTDTTSGGDSDGGQSGGGSSGNPYLLMPANRNTSADRCTPNSLEDCLCETQEARPLEGLAICYQPKKTASGNMPTKGRRG